MEQLLSDLLQRPLSATQLRVALVVATLTSGRNRATVATSIEAVARACHSARPHVSPVVEQLENWGILGRDEKRGLWWLQPADLWLLQPDPDLVAALGDVVERDERRRQPALIPDPGEIAASEFLTPPSEKLTEPPSEKLTVSSRARVPGTRSPDQNQEISGNGTGGGWSHAQWQLLRSLHAWCGESGETCDESQEKNWRWRTWKLPQMVAAALRAAVDHVNAGKPYKLRYGLVKRFWRIQEVGGKLPTASRSADRLHDAKARPAPAGGVDASAPAAEPEIYGPPSPPGSLRRAVLASMRSTRCTE